MHVLDNDILYIIYKDYVKITMDKVKFAIACYIPINIHVNSGRQSRWIQLHGSTYVYQLRCKIFDTRSVECEEIGVRVIEKLFNFKNLSPKYFKKLHDSYLREVENPFSWCNVDTKAMSMMQQWENRTFNRKPHQKMVFQEILFG